MSSRSKDTPEHTLPTPASTPSPILSTESGDESDSADFSTSAHTATLFSTNHPPPPIMSSTIDEFATPAQRQAAYVTNLLHKTPIKPALSATNYVAWSDSVRFGLSATSYNSFIESDEVEESALDPSRHTATKKVIFNWLLANMETSQATRFISMISNFKDGVKITPFAPALLWKTV